VNFQLSACRNFRFILLPALADMAATAGPRREQMLAFIRAEVA
jgi:hypothetical protein